jgi:heme oxygenase
MMKDTILKSLKQSTRERHASLESQLPLLDPELSLDSYRHLMTRFFGYYAPLEAMLLSLPYWDEIDFDYVVRIKTPRLEQDLLALGATPETLAGSACCQNLPSVDSIPNILGCLYVIEGATLGGQIITSRLQATLGLTMDSGASFFNGYGAETGSHWHAFGKLVTAYAERFGGDEDIITTANQTFDTLDQWLFPKAPTRPAL